MRVRSRVGWAVAASLAAHALLVAGGSLLTREEAPSHARPVFDTRVTIGVAPEREATPPVQVVPEPAPETSVPMEPPTTADVPDPPVATGGRSGVSAPRIVPVPSVLPESVLAHVRRFAPAPDRTVRPAAAVSRPAHGALGAGQRVVYLLDASGSMGEWGKFAAARDVLAATVALQPASVDVKVVAYSATAELLTPTALAARTPVGRGDHLAGLRLALAHGPDFVVWFTDADDLPTAAVRAQLRRPGKPVTLVLARVGPNGVGTPTELR